jgi:hypothetical protein
MASNSRSTVVMVSENNKIRPSDALDDNVDVSSRPEIGANSPPQTEVAEVAEVGTNSPSEAFSNLGPIAPTGATASKTATASAGASGGTFGEQVTQTLAQPGNEILAVSAISAVPLGTHTLASSLSSRSHHGTTRNQRRSACGYCGSNSNRCRRWRLGHFSSIPRGSPSIGIQY